MLDGEKKGRNRKYNHRKACFNFRKGHVYFTAAMFDFN
jgi:hypothetical protein